MKTIRIFLALGTLFSLTSFASGHPPALARECNDYNDIQVCRILEDFGTGAAALEITYADPTHYYSQPTVDVWVRSANAKNDKGYYFTLERSGPGFTGYITEGCLEMGAYCKVYGTAAMKDTLQGAYKGNGEMNTLDLEVAIGGSYIDFNFEARKVH